MTTLPPGLYESLVTDALAARLESLPKDRREQTDDLRTAEAADRIAWHIASVVERAIETLPEKERTTAGSALARTLVDRVVEATNVPELTDHRPHDRSEVLRAVRTLNPDGAPAAVDAPLIPLLDSALLTNSPGEPAVGHQVATVTPSPHPSAIDPVARRGPISHYVRTGYPTTSSPLPHRGPRAAAPAVCAPSPCGRAPHASSAMITRPPR